MRLTSVLRYIALYGAAVGLGATVASSCINVNYPIVAFRCNPRQQDNCPETHFCCSDDPAAENGDLPAFMGKNISGSTPYFSGMNNSLGTSGLCVNRDEIPFVVYGENTAEWEVLIDTGFRGGVPQSEKSRGGTRYPLQGRSLVLMRMQRRH